MIFKVIEPRLILTSDKLQPGSTPSAILRNGSQMLVTVALLSPDARLRVRNSRGRSKNKTLGIFITQLLTYYRWGILFILLKFLAIFLFNLFFFLFFFTRFI